MRLSGERVKNARRKRESSKVEDKAFSRSKRETCYSGEIKKKRMPGAVEG